MAQKIILAAGTYDGVLAGWELNLQLPPHGDVASLNSAAGKLKMVFASPVHGGSVRSLTVSNNALLLSTGYDEVLKTHDFTKGLTSSGEVRTPADFGTPVCAAFAPPLTNCTHCLVGFGSTSGGESAVGGKLVIYKKRDWSIQHVLNGHEGGVSTVAVHVTGKLALTGGLSDGKLKLWDLERGRLAYSSSIPTAATHVEGCKHYEAINCIVWSQSGDVYGFCYGTHITVRDVATGKELLDVELPSRVNQSCFLEGPQGLFVAAACNDGSLPLLAVGSLDEIETENQRGERRAIMAIEPVDGPVAGEERFKCIQVVTGYFVATANSAGVVSLMDLQGAVNMLVDPDISNSDSINRRDNDETPVQSESDNDDTDDEGEDDDGGEEELAVDIIDSVQLGTGARITCLAAWASSTQSSVEIDKEVIPTEESAKKKSSKIARKESPGRGGTTEVLLDSTALERARALVSKAKQIQKRKIAKKHKVDKRR